MLTAKNKLDSILGIGDIKELFEGSDVDSVLEQVKETIATNEKELGVRVNTVKGRLDAMNALVSSPDKTSSGDLMAEFKEDTLDITKSLDELNGIIGYTKGILTSLYQYVTQTNLIDPDVIAAVAKIIDSGSTSIKTYIELYREQIRCASNLKLELLRHQSKMEVEEKKAELKYFYAKKMQEESGGGGKSIDTDFVEFTTEDVLRDIRDSQKRDAEAS